MDRIIKFRAWNGKEMLDPFRFSHLLSNYHTEYASGTREDLAEYNFHTGSDEPLEVMQFTGLSDKMGREIYEGDLVEIPLRWGTPSPSVCEVVFEEGMYVAKSVRKYDIQGKGLRYLTLGLRDKSIIEVIGNVHQNPELLP